jgi:hypothetical protein
MAPHSEYRTPRGRRPGPALTNTRAPLLYRILRALASRGIFAEVEDRRFAVTPLADPLRSASEGSVRAYAIFASQAFAQRPWEQMLETPRTGQPGFDQVYGAPLFEYLATDARAGEIFNEAMTSNSSREAEAVVAAYDFMGLQSIVVRSATTCGSPHRRAKNAVTPLGGSRDRVMRLCRSERVPARRYRGRVRRAQVAGCTKDAVRLVAMLDSARCRCWWRSQLMRPR